MFTCAAWAVMACVIYIVIFLRLMRELNRKKLEHSKASKAAAQVSPKWSEDTAFERPLARRFAVLQENSAIAKDFFPAFKPTSSASTDPAEVLFTKVFRNILLTGAFALLPFGFLACVSSY